MRMRRLAGVALSAVMVLPIGFAASPAGAAGGETCTHLLGPAFFTPPLPKIPDKTKVLTTLKATTLEFHGCTGPGGGVGKVSLTAKAKAKANCTTLNAGASMTLTGSMTIKWTKGKPSTIAVSLVTPTRKPLTATVTGKVTAGQFLGLNASASIVYGPTFGACATTPLSKVVMPLAKGTKFVIG